MHGMYPNLAGCVGLEIFLKAEPAIESLHLAASYFLAAYQNVLVDWRLSTNPIESIS